MEKIVPENIIAFVKQFPKRKEYVKAVLENQV
jgi:hypothetical protein